MYYLSKTKWINHGESNLAQCTLLTVHARIYDTRGCMHTHAEL